jgi:hypothetical protein
MMNHAGDDSRKAIDFAFERVTARPPSDEEAEVLLAEFNKQRDSFAKEPDAATALLTVGESPRDEKLDPVAHAAWTNVALVILNLDEAVCR